MSNHLFSSERRPASTPGRSPSGKGLRRTVLNTVGRDARAICENVRALAAAGDPQAIIAASNLLAAVMTTDPAAEALAVAAE